MYDYFKDKEGIAVLHCMAHARRMFYEARDNDKATAEYALQQIGLLYNLERKSQRTAARTASNITTTQQRSCACIRIIRRMDEGSLHKSVA